MFETDQIDTCDPYHKTYAPFQCDEIKTASAESIQKCSP